MIFINTLGKVLDGTQTQAHYPLKGRKRILRTGRIYTVRQSVAQVSAAKVQLLSVRRQRLREVTDADAVAEGFTDLSAFRCYWIKRYKHFDPNEQLLVIKFELVGNQA